MVTGFLDKLKDIKPLEFNNSVVSGNASQIPTNLINNLKTQLGGFWIDFTMFILFVWLLYMFTKKYDVGSYDFIRGIFLSSGFTLIMATGLLLSGWSENIYPLFLYGVIFLISMIYTYELKAKE